MITQDGQHVLLPPETKLRVLIASDDSAMGERVRDYLRNQADCLAHGVARIEATADRAAHVNPGLVILVLPPRRELAYQVMREVSQAMTASILAVGPAEDPQLILRTLHEGGADEYLDARRLEEELAGALLRFRRRRTTSSECPRVGRVISVLGPSGGSGTSTLAVNIAASLASQHERCGLVDLRLTAGDLSALLDMQSKYGIADLCDNLPRLDRSMFEQFFAPHPSGVRLLAAPRDLALPAKVHPKGVRQAVAMARAELPCVIIDLDNAVGEEQLEAIWQSDVVTLVLRLDYTSLRNARRTLDHLVQTGVDRNRLRLVANRVGERSQLTSAEAEQALGQKIVHQIPDEPARVNAAINAGVPVVLHSPRSRVARRLVALATILYGEQGSTHPNRPWGSKWFGLASWRGARLANRNTLGVS